MSTMIARHPDAVTLMSFAAGTLPEPLAAVVAAHAAMCSQCRRELSDLDALGAALLQQEPKAASPSRSVVNFKAVAAHQDVAATAPARHIDRNERLPAPIAAAYDLSMNRIPWKRLGIGIWHHRLPLSHGNQGDLRLLKIGPGRQMPDHGHGGAELTLVVDGAFSDNTGVYKRGDLQDLDDSIEHTPLADQTEGCICLIASELPARFKGRIARLLQPLSGM